MSLALRPKSVDFDGCWSTLKECVKQCLTLNKVNRVVWNDSFSLIYDLCVAVPNSFSDRLYEETQTCLKEHVQALYLEIKETNSADILTAYQTRWDVYHQGAAVIQNLFSYLNRQYLKAKKFSDADLQFGCVNLPTPQSYLEIGELALVTWHREMILPLEECLLSHLLAAIAADRRGDTLVPQSVVKGVINSFVQVDEYRATDQHLVLYCEMFEERFLLETSNHYKAEAVRLLAEHTISDYMKLVIQRLEDEDLRAQKFLHNSSYGKVRAMCQDVMVAQHQARFHAVCREVVQNEQNEDLSHMYTLLKPIPSALGVLNKEFEMHVRKLGMDAVQNLSGDMMHVQFLENILAVHEKFSKIVGSVFVNDQEFFSAMDKALLSTVNYKEESRGPPKASEWVAKYCDTLLRKSAKGLSEGDVDQKLTMAIVIFRYIDDKDVFQKFYSRMLAQRLIHGASVSMDAEEAMINKLKAACGYEFTNKLVRMFTDIGLSKELTDNFHADLTKQAEAAAAAAGDGEEVTKSKDIWIQVKVLQAGAWPLSAPGQQSTTIIPTFNVPKELQPSINAFETFYTKNYSGRKLTWLFNMATADVRLLYTDKHYIPCMTIQQLSVLLCFAQHEQLSFGHIERETQLTPELLNKMIRSLVDSQILKCALPVTDLSSDSVLELNTAFTSKKLKFKITAPSLPKQAEKVETDHVVSTIQQDRKYFLECTVVRVMKTRKVLKHTALIDEVIRQSRARFTPDVAFIKKVIESLIEKQYLQRTDQSDEYSYLA